ncbi:tRNA (N6-threonylcarbamoyladenosine(37)-N6)-methyltransferase TrmO [Desulfovermiculus halophilus]|uniref:tRNA (N6-threonylcarbamoyladenosine(37)-N6)-methyltransferase TrmO n=1 Tax=Desulfovermiculus halophilus TaxID=339722 RepID=UPI000489246A|nr:tRNA (N6-threonylcarbamoyladenosine(37)-N6)-methyltransferase TrmO [Desulfovermiculus halophilus]
MRVTFSPIGTVRTKAETLPRHWSLSEVEGTLEVEARYAVGLRDIKPGQRIVVLFYFHKSPEFDSSFLVQTPPHKDRSFGVFSICSPRRPNPIGLSIVTVGKVVGNTIEVKGLDMLDGTPILDIKPHIEGRQECPSWNGE